MKRACDICGLVNDDYWMHAYVAGAKTMWLCNECHRVAQREANLSDDYRRRKLKKMSKERDR